MTIIFLVRDGTKVTELFPSCLTADDIRASVVEDQTWQCCWGDYMGDGV